VSCSALTSNAPNSSKQQWPGAIPAIVVSGGGELDRGAHADFDGEARFEPLPRNDLFVPHRIHPGEGGDIGQPDDRLDQLGLVGAGLPSARYLSENEHFPAPVSSKPQNAPLPSGTANEPFDD
jgi:hypothetical protein